MKGSSEEKTTLGLLRAAKRGRLHEHPELLSFENLTRRTKSVAPNGRSYNVVEVAANNGHLDQIPHQVLDQLGPTTVKRLKERDTMVREHRAKVEKGEDAPF